MAKTLIKYGFFWSTSTKMIEIGETMYAVGRAIPKALYDPEVLTRKGEGFSKYSLSLYALKYFKEGAFRIEHDAVKVNFYAVINGKEVFVLDDVIATSEKAPLDGTELAAVISAVSASRIGIETSDYEDIVPGTFCDSVYYRYMKDHNFYEDNDRFPSDEEKEIIKKEIGEKTAEYVFEEAPAAVPEEPSKAPEAVDEFDSYRIGEHIVNYEFDDAVKAYIPPLSDLDDFVPNKYFYSFAKKLEKKFSRVLKRMAEGKEGIAAIGDDAVNAIFSGPCGTGKSRTVRAVCAALGLPLFTNAFNPDTNPGFAEGEAKIVDSQLEFVRSPLSYAMEYGGIWDGEEPNMTNADMVFGVMSQIAEKPYQLLENGVRTITRHPLCVLTMCYNTGTYGAKPMSQALLNRFAQCYEMEEPDEKDFINLLVKYQPDATYGGRDRKKVCKWVYDAYMLVLNELEKMGATEIMLALSLRTCRAVLDNIDEGEDPKEALRCFWIPVGAYDMDFKDSIKGVLDSFRNL